MLVFMVKWAIAAIPALHILILRWNLGLVRIFGSLGRIAEFGHWAMP